jgi:uncharacterized cupin superfamily protein
MIKEQDDELEYIQQLIMIMRTQGVTYLKNSRVELTLPPTIPEIKGEQQPFTQQEFREPEMPISMAMWGMKNGT